MAVLNFSHNEFYVNPSRAPKELISTEMYGGEYAVLAADSKSVAVFVTVIAVKWCHIVVPKPAYSKDMKRVKCIEGLPFAQESRLLESYFGEVFKFKTMVGPFYRGGFTYSSRFELDGSGE